MVDYGASGASYLVDFTVNNPISKMLGVAEVANSLGTAASNQVNSFVLFVNRIIQAVAFIIISIIVVNTGASKYVLKLVNRIMYLIWKLSLNVYKLTFEGLRRIPFRTYIKDGVETKKFYLPTQSYSNLVWETIKDLLSACREEVTYSDSFRKIIVYESITEFKRVQEISDFKKQKQEIDSGLEDIVELTFGLSIESQNLTIKSTNSNKYEISTKKYSLGRQPEENKQNTTFLFKKFEPSGVSRVKETSSVTGGTGYSGFESAYNPNRFRTFLKNKEKYAKLFSEFIETKYEERVKVVSNAKKLFDKAESIVESISKELKENIVVYPKYASSIVSTTTTTTTTTVASEVVGSVVGTKRRRSEEFDDDSAEKKRKKIAENVFRESPKENESTKVNSATTDTSLSTLLQNFSVSKNLVEKLMEKYVNLDDNFLIDEKGNLVETEKSSFLTANDRNVLEVFDSELNKLIDKSKVAIRTRESGINSKDIFGEKEANDRERSQKRAELNFFDMNKDLYSRQLFSRLFSTSNEQDTYQLPTTSKLSNIPKFLYPVSNWEKIRSWQFFRDSSLLNLYKSYSEVTHFCSKIGEKTNEVKCEQEIVFGKDRRLGALIYNDLERSRYYNPTNAFNLQQKKTTGFNTKSQSLVQIKYGILTNAVDASVEHKKDKNGKSIFLRYPENTTTQGTIDYINDIISTGNSKPWLRFSNTDEEVVNKNTVSVKLVSESVYDEISGTILQTFNESVLNRLMSFGTKNDYSDNALSSYGHKPIKIQGRLHNELPIVSYKTVYNINNLREVGDSLQYYFIIEIWSPLFGVSVPMRLCNSSHSHQIFNRLKPRPSSQEIGIKLNISKIEANQVYSCALCLIRRDPEKSGSYHVVPIPECSVDFHLSQTDKRALVVEFNIQPSKIHNIFWQNACLPLESSFDTINIIPSQLQESLTKPELDSLFLFYTFGKISNWMLYLFNIYYDMVKEMFMITQFGNTNKPETERSNIVTFLDMGIQLVRRLINGFERLPDPVEYLKNNAPDQITADDKAFWYALGNNLQIAFQKLLLVMDG